MNLVRRSRDLIKSLRDLSKKAARASVVREAFCEIRLLQVNSSVLYRFRFGFIDVGAHVLLLRCFVSELSLRRPPQQLPNRGRKSSWISLIALKYSPRLVGLLRALLVGLSCLRLRCVSMLLDAACPSLTSNLRDQTYSLVGLQRDVDLIAGVWHTYSISAFSHRTKDLILSWSARSRTRTDTDRMLLLGSGPLDSKSSAAT